MRKTTMLSLSGTWNLVLTMTGAFWSPSNFPRTSKSTRNSVIIYVNSSFMTFQFYDGTCCFWKCHKRSFRASFGKQAEDLTHKQILVWNQSMLRIFVFSSILLNQKILQKVIKPNVKEIRGGKRVKSLQSRFVYGFQRLHWWCLAWESSVLMLSCCCQPLIPIQTASSVIEFLQLSLTTKL